MLELTFLAGFLTIAMYSYLFIARKQQIIDLPNHRSSHQHITIRGGGIVIPIAILSYWVVYQHYHFFVCGVLIISTISFLDDIKPLSSKIRILFHFLAVCCLFYELNLLAPYHWLLLPMALTLVIGWINAVNFMDGINGITVSYSIITVITFFFINDNTPFIDTTLLKYFLGSLIIFAFFNFRKKALCFAGDIGSVSIALTLGFLMLSLIIQYNQIAYLGLFLVYAIDSVGTIIERLINKQNIFEPHRLHLYQRLANDSKISHLKISIIYSLIQLGINILIIYSINQSQDSIYTAITLLIVLSIIYLAIKQKLFRII